MMRPLRTGLVGTGRIAHAHMTAYLEHPDRVRLAAVCDIDASAAKTYAKQASVRSIYTHFEDMLRHGDVDAVDICSVHDQHPAQAIAAAEAGKHVLTESAMASTLDGCRRMIEAAERAGVILMVAQNLRYTPEAAAAKALIDAGGIGEIRAVQTHAIFGVGAASPSGHWTNDGRRAGGGILMTKGIHHLDLLRYHVGNVKRVTGICRTVQPQRVNGAEDLVVATLEFENGAIGDVLGNWTTFLSPEAMSYLVFGSEGTLHSTPPSTPSQALAQFGTITVARGLSGGEGAMPRPDFAPLPIDGVDLPSDNCFVNEILHFEECCRSGTEPITSGRDNIETVRVIMGIYESSRTGRAVELETL